MKALVEEAVQPPVPGAAAVPAGQAPHPGSHVDPRNERMGRLDSAAAIYEEIVRLCPIGDAREFAGYSLAYERYALRRLVAMGGPGADDARRQLRHAWQDAEAGFRRWVVGVVLGR